RTAIGTPPRRCHRRFLALRRRRPIHQRCRIGPRSSQHRASKRLTRRDPASWRNPSHPRLGRAAQRSFATQSAGGFGPSPASHTQLILFLETPAVPRSTKPAEARRRRRCVCPGPTCISSVFWLASPLAFFLFWLASSIFMSR